MFCFSYGFKAGVDLFVDDKLQIGLVTPEAQKLIYHPEVNFRSEMDYLNYIFGDFGLPIKEIDEDGHLKAGSVKGLLNDLYTFMLVTAKRMEDDDIEANKAHTSSKTNSANREKHEEKRRVFIGRRDEEKGYLKDLIGSWLSGDLQKVKEELLKFTEKRIKIYNGAIDFSEELKTKGEAK